MTVTVVRRERRVVCLVTFVPLFDLNAHNGERPFSLRFCYSSSDTENDFTLDLNVFSNTLSVKFRGHPPGPMCSRATYPSFSYFQDLSLLSISRHGVPCSAVAAYTILGHKPPNLRVKLSSTHAAQCKASRRPHRTRLVRKKQEWDAKQSNRQHSNSFGRLHCLAYPLCKRIPVTHLS